MKQANEIDQAKKDADFRLVAVGKKNTIIWKSGKVEFVTDKKLDQLSTSNIWVHYDSKRMRRELDAVEALFEKICERFYIPKGDV